MLRTEAIAFIRRQDIDRSVRKQESDKIKRGMVNIPRKTDTPERRIRVGIIDMSPQRKQRLKTISIIDGDVIGMLMAQPQSNPHSVKGDIECMDDAPRSEKRTFPKHIVKKHTKLDVKHIRRKFHGYRTVQSR